VPPAAHRLVAVVAVRLNFQAGAGKSMASQVGDEPLSGGPSAERDGVDPVDGRVEIQRDGELDGRPASSDRGSSTPLA
jgi:hypothetical protein